MPGTSDDVVVKSDVILRCGDAASSDAHTSVLSSMPHAATALSLCRAGRGAQLRGVR